MNYNPKITKKYGMGGGKLTPHGQTHFGLSESLQNVHGGGYTHTNIKYKRTDLLSRFLDANLRVPRGHVQKGDT